MASRGPRSGGERQRSREREHPLAANGIPEHREAPQTGEVAGTQQPAQQRGVEGEEIEDDGDGAAALDEPAGPSEEASGTTVIEAWYAQQAGEGLGDRVNPISGKPEQARSESDPSQLRAVERRGEVAPGIFPQPYLAVRGCQRRIERPCCATPPGVTLGPPRSGRR